MKPATLDLDIYQGDSRDLTIRIKRKVSSNPDTYEYIDLTGSTVLAQIRPTAGSETILATFAGFVSNQTTLRGGALLRLTPAQTAALAAGQSAIWDCEVTFPSGEVKTFLRGTVTVTAEVSRP